MEVIRRACACRRDSLTWLLLYGIRCKRRSKMSRDGQQSVEVRGGGICGGRRSRLTYSLGNSPIANTHSRLVWEWETGRQRGLSTRKAGGGVFTFPQAPSPTITSFLRIWTNASDPCPYTRWRTRAKAVVFGGLQECLWGAFGRGVR